MYKPNSPCYFTRLPEQFGGKIPFIVTDLVTRLRAMNALNEVGLFRLNGSQAEVNEIVGKLDKDRIRDWSKYENIHSIANTLKKYFRDKVDKNPFFPSRYNPQLEFLSAMPDDKIALGLREILVELPKARIMTLSYLIKFLAELDKNNEVNKMNAVNISIVFGPNFFDIDPKIFGPLFSSLILNYDSIFEGFMQTEEYIINDDDMKYLEPLPIDTNGLAETLSHRKASTIPYLPSYIINATNFQFPSRKVEFV